MKKLTRWLVVLVMISTMSACSRKANQPNKQLNILTSFYPIYLTTKNITVGIKGVSVTNMTEPQTGCLHDYSLLPSDMIKLEKADIVVVNGAGMESFIEKVVGELPNLKIIEASQGYELLKDSHTGSLNPHIWVTPTGAIHQLHVITRELCRLDPAHAQAYQKNATLYEDKLIALRQTMKTALQKVPNRDIVTFHEAFPYFAKEYNLTILAVIEREPGSEPTPKELEALIQHMQKLPKKILFVEPQYPDKIANTIARETGATIYTLDPVVTGEDLLDAYLTTMEQNLKTLVEALS